MGRSRRDPVHAAVSESLGSCTGGWPGTRAVPGACGRDAAARQLRHTGEEEEEEEEEEEDDDEEEEEEEQEEEG